MLRQIRELNLQILDNKNNTSTVRKIDKIIENNLCIDEEWKNFKLHFDKVHPNFFEKIKKQNIELTEENLKLCAYIKIGLTVKQIAQMLYILPRSVIKGRNRLKKKLNLSEDEDLDNFIGNLK